MVRLKARDIFYLLCYVSALMLLAWQLLAIHFDLQHPQRNLIALVYGLFAFASLFVIRHQLLGKVFFLTTSGLVIVWWLSLKPSGIGNWAADAAVLPRATVLGNLVTVHNVRNTDYRTEDDYDVRYEDRTYDMSKLATADLFISYWGPRLIAHTVLSFGFTDGQFLAFSVETRKKKGQEYSAVAGFFRQYELIYVAADERDLIRLRTNYRGENVYCYRLRTDLNRIRGVFLYYLKRINELSSKPEFYNALLHNCTTNIYIGVKSANPAAPFTLGVLLPGYLDRYLYTLHAKLHGDGLTYEQFRKRNSVNDAAKQADQDPAFSKIIRTGRGE